jgi:hypothetical protein
MKNGMKEKREHVKNEKRLAGEAEKSYLCKLKAGHMKRYLPFQQKLFMNNIINSVILGITIVLMSNCASRHALLVNGISFVYLPGEVDTSIPISGDIIRKHCEFLDADTVIITYREYTAIRQKAEDVVKCITEDVTACDTRMLVSIDSITSFCISAENLICGLNRKMNEEDSLFLYKLKSLSSYYNFYSKEGLSHDLLVQRYGIPTDYQPVQYSKHQKKDELKKVVAFYPPQ